MLGSLYVLLLNLIMKLKRSVINPHFIDEVLCLKMINDKSKFVYY